MPGAKKTYIAGRQLVCADGELVRMGILDIKGAQRIAVQEEPG
jgi:hypothetical protein